MFTVHLHQLQFFAHHGVHEEERLLGNHFEVNVDVQFYSEEKIETLEQTVNYAAVYELIKKRMSVPTPLLETIAQELAETIHENFPEVLAVNISIYKKHPPIAAFEGQTGISYSQTF